MIDIWGVLANSLWIVGMTILLATFSWAYWIAQEKGHRLRTVIDRPRIQQVLNGGGFLFCVGLAATAHAWWESILWGLLAAAWVVRVWLTRVSARKKNVHRQGAKDADTNDNAP
jgi:hypothetical protein